MKIFILINLQILLCVTQYIHDEDTNLIFPDWEIFYSPLDIIETKYITSVNNCLCRECPGVRIVCCGNNCTNFPADIVVTLPLFKLQLSYVEIIRKNDLRNLSNLTALEIEGNLKLRKIEEGAFKNMINLKNLTITSNRELKYFEEKVFEGLINLKILCISKNGFLQISDITRACSPKYIPKVKLLSLIENSFSEIRYDDFYPMNGTHLQQLNIILCHVIKVHPDSLEPLKHLTQLRLCQNLFNKSTLTNLVQRTLEFGINLDILNLFESGLRRVSPYPLLESLGRSNLSYLILAGNDFNSIYNEWFPYMPRLLNLDMRFCSIVDISDNAFRPLPNLQRLLLKANRLTTIPLALTLPKGLFFLDMSFNSNDESISYFNMPLDIFKNNLTNVSSLHIGYNNIGFLYKSTFNGLTSIKKLIIKNAFLSYIESGCFANMKMLSYLELTNNPLLSLMPITADTFLGLKNLRVLLLGGCSLQNLTSSPGIFTHMTNLTHLGLDNNNLRIISPDQLTNLSSLTELKLSNNKLPSWNKRILPSPNLSVLDLEQNKFINITIAMLEDWQTVKFLYLKDNPFWCDCTLYSAAKWRKHNKMAFVTKDIVSQCVAPEYWRGRTTCEFIEHLNNNYHGECDKKMEIIIVVTECLLLVLVVVGVVLVYWYRWNIRYCVFLWRLSFLKHNPWRRTKGRKDEREFLYDVYVSHAAEDTTWVCSLLARLEPMLRLRVLAREAQPGEPRCSEPPRSLTTSRSVLLVLSEASARCRWCRWEAQLAVYHQMPIVLVRLQPITPANLTHTLYYLMKTKIYLDWPLDPKKQSDFWHKLELTLFTPLNDGA